MKLSLDYKIDVEVKEGNKSKEKLTVFLREFTREEKKDFTSIQKKFRDIFNAAQKISKKQIVLDKKAELFQLDGQFDKALEAICEKEKLDKEAENLQDDLVEIGGEDQIEFAEETAKKRFGMLVGGAGKEKL